MRRLDLHLAAAAAQVLRESGIAPSDNDLRSRMASLPALLQSSGLPATCAFLLAKGKPHDVVAATALLQEAASVARLDRDQAPDALLEALTGVEEHLLAVGEHRAAMLGMWLARLAAARFKAQR